MLKEEKQAKIAALNAKRELKEKVTVEDKAARLKALAEKAKLIRQSMKKRPQTAQPVAAAAAAAAANAPEEL